MALERVISPVTVNGHPTRSLATHVVLAARNGDRRQVAKRASPESQSSSGSSAPSVDVVTPGPSTNHLEAIRLGKLIGKGAFWDVYKITNAPGYVAKICFLGGTLFNHYGWDTLSDAGERIVNEIETDTRVAIALGESGHVPVTCGLWHAYWEQTDPNKVECAWEMYVAVQEEVRQDGKFKQLRSWADLSVDHRQEIIDWIGSLRKQGYNNGDIEARHCYVADGGKKWKIVDWGRTLERDRMDEEEFDLACGDEEIDSRLIIPRHY
ncbi:hypothetical protein IAR50_001376 [Cryptococcus sp. DSM 104548]